MLLKRIAAVFLVGTIAVSLTACKQSGPNNADKTINYNLTSEPQTLDPQIADDPDSFTVIQALYEGLTRLDADGKALPGVAEKWAANSDDTEFTFTLRPDAKWSDGTPVTANDFVFAFQRALSPATGSPTSSQMFCIKNAKKVNAGQMPPEQLGVAAEGDHTLVVQMEYPSPDFPTLAASPVFMPCSQKFFSTTAGRYGLDKSYILGNGPFEIDGKYGWEHGKYLNLKRSPYYSGNQKPLPSNVDFSLTGSDAIAANPVAALTSSTVDAVAMPYADTPDAKAAGCTLLSSQDTAWGLSFNTQSDFMKNEKVRKAFVQAFDRSKVLSHLPGNGKAADDILLPSTELSGQSYLSLAGGPFYLKQDQNAASTLSKGLQELGQTEMPSIDVLCPDDANVKLMLNEMIIAWNTEFHNYFNLQALPEDQLESRVLSGNYQIAICPVKPAGEGPLAALSLFRSGDPANPAGLKDSAYDALLSSAETQAGAGAAKKYAAADQYLNQHAIFYPLYYEDHFFAMAKGVTGILYHPFLGSVDFIDAGKE